MKATCTQSDFSCLLVISSLFLRLFIFCFYLLGPTRGVLDPDFPWKNWLYPGVPWNFFDFQDPEFSSSSSRRLFSSRLRAHSVIQGQFPPQAKSKIFNSSPKRFLPQHFQKWLPPTLTDHFFVDFHSNLQTSKYDARA